MKKIYSLLLFLIFAGTVPGLAQNIYEGKYIKSVGTAITSLTDLKDGGYYLMQTVGRGERFVYETNDGALRSLNTALADVPGVENLNHVVRLAKVEGEDNSYYIQVKSGKYIPVAKGNTILVPCAEDATNYGYYTIANISGASFSLKGQGDNDWMDANGSDGSWNIVTYSYATTTEGGNGAYRFYPVVLDDESNAVSVTYNLKWNGNVIKTRTYTVDPAATYPQPWASGTYYTVTGYPEGTVTAGTYDLTLTYTDDNIGNALSANTSSDAKWVAMKMRGTKWLGGNTTNLDKIHSDATWHTDLAAIAAGYEQIHDNLLWCITGNPFDGFQIMNKLTGKVMASDNKNDGTPIKMKNAGVDNSLFVYEIVGSNKGLKIKDGSEYINDNESAKQIKYYWSCDGGSNVVFVLNPDFGNFTTNNIPAQSECTISGNALVVGGYNLWDSSNPLSGENETLFANCQSRRITINPDSYYMIQCVRDLSDDKYTWISSQSIKVDTNGELQAGEGNARKIFRVKRSEGLPVAMLWQFDGDSENGYKIRSANTGCAWGQNSENMIDMITQSAETEDDTNAGKYRVQQVANSYNKWMLNENRGEGDHIVNAYNGINNPANAELGEYNHPSDDGGHWYLYEVNSVPLTLYADTKWASACYPFGVVLPGELEAYVAVKAEGNEVVLSPIGQNVPAKTPVFITTTGTDITADANYTLAIDNSIAAISKTNLLEGATAERAGFEAESNYVLTIGAAIKKANVTTIPANKAYLPVANVTDAGTAAANVLTFSFGETTGIDAVKGNESKAGSDVYYDLNGRRVFYPAHGIYVKGNGQKVYIK